MAYIPLRQIGSGGLVTDQDPYDLELTQFPSGNNVAFHEGRLGKCLGQTIKTTTPYAPTHVAGWLYSGSNTLVIGTLQKLYRFDGTNMTNVTKTSDGTNYSNAPRWQGASGASCLLGAQDSPRSCKPYSC